MFSFLFFLPRAPLAHSLFLAGALLPLGAVPSSATETSTTAPAWAATPVSSSASVPGAATIDDFSSATRHGAARFVVDDRALGSHSHATLACKNGVLAVRGELAPGRGVPAFISVPLGLAADWRPVDASAWTGVRLRVKILKGVLTVQVASAGITNFDYHTSGPVAAGREAFQEVRVPFASMKRAWSEQTPLDLKAVTSVNLVAFGMTQDAFAYEVDEIGFY